MAYLVMAKGNPRSVPADVGLKLWQGLQNPDKLDEEQLAFLEGVDKIYLNWRVAPDDYVAENLEWIAQQALNEWSVRPDGSLSRPATNEAWIFAKKWGLWLMGQPTILARRT